MKWTTKTFAIWMALLIAVSMLPACSSNDDSGLTDPQSQGTAPELPAMSTMVMNLDFFGVKAPDVSQQALVTGKPGPELQTAAVSDRTNWINGFVRALFLQLLMFDALEEPVGAFALAIHSIPQYQGDDSWLWTYIFIEDSIEYSIYLYGTPNGTYADWRMEVSTTDPEFLLDHFVWFSGRTYSDNSEGYWQFYDPAFDQPALASSATITPGVQTIRIDWENASASEHRLTVTVNGIGHEDEGDYLEFYESSTMGSITHYDVSADLTANITYYSDGSGSLTVHDFNNGEQACWDQHQFDTTCPQ